MGATSRRNVTRSSAPKAAAATLAIRARLRSIGGHYLQNLDRNRPGYDIALLAVYTQAAADVNVVFRGARELGSGDGKSAGGAVLRIDLGIDHANVRGAHHICIHRFRKGL